MPIGSKKKREKRYDWVRDNKKKGWTEHNIELAIKDPLIEVEEDPIEVPVSSRKFGKYGLGLKNLMEMDEDSLLREIESFEHMMPESTIKLHLKNMWEQFFEKKSLIGKEQLFVRLFRKRDMSLILEFLGVSNKKISKDHVKKTIV